jgi:DMSO/TMAO reductase YedYZ molybdopterin-dependent catalytic subunit
MSEPENPTAGNTPEEKPLAAGAAEIASRATPESTTPSERDPMPAAGAVPATSAAGAPEVVPMDEPARSGAPPSPAFAAPAAARRDWREGLSERPETVIEVPETRLAAQSRRDFLIFAVGVAAAAGGAWWLLPDRTRARLLPGVLGKDLDSIASRVGLSRANREKALDRALTFDDDVAEALYSKDRRVRTYDRSQTTYLRNNYNGDTPDPDYLDGWALQVSGLASGRLERFSIDQLMKRFGTREQVTRLVCVEGWSAVAWWGGIRFADFLAAFPPAPGARFAAIRSAVNLDGNGNPDPYYVSIDLDTARHPQALLATHLGGRPLGVDHGAPLRLVVPMKLGLKNIKAITEIAYTAKEPPDYWNERGYSKYDGL